MKTLRILSTEDLTTSERRFVDLAQELGFGRFEHLRIEGGQLILDASSKTAREIKFCAKSGQPAVEARDFALKQQLVELFEHVRSIGAGKIRKLEIRHGLPFSMEIEHIGDIGESDGLG